jgi:hypothetical protein
MAVDVSKIYVHDGTLLRVHEEPAQSRITFEVELPDIETETVFLQHRLVFEDVYGYRVQEGFINGCPTLLGLSVVGHDGCWSWVRVDTTVGYREFLCSSVSVHAASKDGQTASAE